MLTPEPRSVHFPPASILARDAAKPRPEYQRPDISYLRSIIESADQIREELKVIGKEETYATGLRVLSTQGRMIASLADELLARYAKSGSE
jgi:hypothetical protein